MKNFTLFVLFVLFLILQNKDVFSQNVFNKNISNYVCVDRFGKKVDNNKLQLYDDSLISWKYEIIETLCFKLFISKDNNYYKFFGDSSTIEAQKKRVALKQVFEDISTIFNTGSSSLATDSKPKIEVIFYDENSSVGGLGIPFFEVPINNNGIIVNSLILSALITTQDVTEGTTYHNSFYGRLKINIHNIMNFDISSTKFSNLDFYSIILHEIFHMLGFGSSVLSMDTSVQQDYFTYFDNFIYFKENNTGNLIKMIIRENGKYTFNKDFKSEYLIKNDIGKLIFKTNDGSQIPLLTENTFEYGSNLSHINSEERYKKYVMYPALSNGEYRRKPSLDEMRILATLGYKLTNIYGYGADTTRFEVYDEQQISSPFAKNIIIKDRAKLNEEFELNLTDFDVELANKTKIIINANNINFDSLYFSSNIIDEKNPSIKIYYSYTYPLDLLINYQIIEDTLESNMGTITFKLRLDSTLCQENGNYILNGGFEVTNGPHNSSSDVYYDSLGNVLSSSYNIPFWNLSYASENFLRMKNKRIGDIINFLYNSLLKERDYENGLAFPSYFVDSYENDTYVMPDSYDKSEFNKSYINFDWGYEVRHPLEERSKYKSDIYNEFIFQKIKLPRSKKLIFSGYFYNNYRSWNNLTINEYDTLSNERIIVTLDTINPIINLNKYLSIPPFDFNDENLLINFTTKNDFGRKIIYSLLPEENKWSNLKSKPFYVDNEDQYIFISTNTDRLLYDSLRFSNLNNNRIIGILKDHNSQKWITDTALTVFFHQIQLDDIVIRESFLGIEGNVSKINPCLGDIVTYTYKISQDDIDSIFDASFYCILDKGLRYISGDFTNVNGQLVCNISKDKFDKNGNYYIHFETLIEDDESNIGKYIFAKIYPMNFDTTKIKSLGRYAVELMPVRRLDIIKEVSDYTNYVCDNQRLHIRYKIINNTNVDLRDVDLIFKIELYDDSLKKYIDYDFTKDTTYNYYNSYDYKYNPESEDYSFIWEVNGVQFRSFRWQMETNFLLPPPYYYFDEYGLLHIRGPLNGKPMDNNNNPDTMNIDIYYRIPKDVEYLKIRITDSTNFNGDACNLAATQNEFEIKRTNFTKKMKADTTTCADFVEVKTGYPDYLNIWDDGFVGDTRIITNNGLYAVKIIDSNNCYFLDTIKVTFDTTRQNWKPIKLGISKITANKNSQIQVAINIPNDRSVTNNYSHYSYDVTYNKNYLKFIDFANSQQILENDSLITIRITSKLNNKNSFDSIKTIISFHTLSSIDTTIIYINNFNFYDFYCSNDTTSLQQIVNINDYEPVSKKLSIDNLYPVPVIDKLNFILSTPKEALISIIIYDMLGKKVKQYSNIPMNNVMTKVSIDVSVLCPGLYYLQVIDSNHSQFVSSKFIIMK